MLEVLLMAAKAGVKDGQKLPNGNQKEHVRQEVYLPRSATKYDDQCV
jgi:hypothetical protein